MRKSEAVTRITSSLDEHFRVKYSGNLNFDFQTFRMLLNNDTNETGDVISRLKLDCRHAFNCRSIELPNQDYSAGSTYFQKACSPPRCYLENLALSIFQLHTKDAVFDPKTSGIEWWTQVIDCRDDIGFHWDRDYGKIYDDM